MEFTNYLAKAFEARVVDESSWRGAITSLVLLLAPTAPHLAEELWARTGHTYSVHDQPWPQWKEELVYEEQITLVIQVNGKLRDRITVPASIGEEEARELALGRERIKGYLQGKEVRKAIYVPGRLINVVVA